MFLQARIGIEEYNTLAFEFIVDLVIDDLGLVLSCHTCDKTLTLGFRNAKSLVGLQNVFWQIFPTSSSLFGGAYEVFNLVEIDAGEICTPGGHRLALKVAQALQTGLQHPLGLFFELGDVTHHVLVEATYRVFAGFVRVVPPEFVGSNGFKFWVGVQNVLNHAGVGGFLTDLIRHYQPLYNGSWMVVTKQKPQ